MSHDKIEVNWEAAAFDFDPDPNDPSQRTSVCMPHLSASFHYHGKQIKHTATDDELALNGCGWTSGYGWNYAFQNVKVNGKWYIDSWSVLPDDSSMWTKFDIENIHDAPKLEFYKEVDVLLDRDSTGRTE